MMAGRFQCLKKRSEIADKGDKKRLKWAELYCKG